MNHPPMDHHVQALANVRALIDRAHLLRADAGGTGSAERGK
jgi:hypothetical protein